MDGMLQMHIDRFQDMNIAFEVFPYSWNEMSQRWEEAFTKDISKSQKRKMSFPQCMWNVFSWEKIECCKEQQAIDAFNQQKKGGCYLIYEGENEAIYIPKAGRIKARDINHPTNPWGIDKSTHEGSDSTDSVNSPIDLYFVDEDFTWTYVLTHELDCGPYFHHL